MGAKFDHQKQVLFTFDKSLLQGRLDTLIVLYGMKGVAEAINEWASQQPTDWGIWKFDMVMDEKEAEAYGKD